MLQLLLQYVLIVALVIGIGYLIYVLKEKDINISDDYYGIANTILNGLLSSEATPETVKNILRVISDAVHYVEDNLKNSDNHTKENEALNMAKDALKALNLTSIIDDDSIRFLIRIACGFLPSTQSK